MDAQGGAGQYAQSWKTAASLFKGGVTLEKWQRSAAAVRGPLGKLQSRALKSASYATTLPGAPDGQYVVMQFASTFEHKQSAIETVTTTRDKDGKWRVSGYSIK